MKADQYKFEGLLLSGSGSDGFPDFYRERIRFREGARLPTAELRAAYGEWASSNGLALASSRSVRAFMEANGHPQSKSSSMFFRNAVLGDFHDQPLPVRSLPIVDARPVREAISVTVDDLDQIIAELHGMRRRLARLMPIARRGREGQR